MNDIEAAISCAWNQIAPRLLADPEELNRRIARRQRKHCARPLRDWCVPLRANDHRIHDTSAITIPRTALSLDASAHPGRYAEHTVTLTKDLLARLSEPVEIGRPGDRLHQVVTGQRLVQVHRVRARHIRPRQPDVASTFSKRAKPHRPLGA